MPICTSAHIAGDSRSTEIGGDDAPPGGPEPMAPTGMTGKRRSPGASAHFGQSTATSSSGSNGSTVPHTGQTFGFATC
jgi:hypothetical protein